MSDSLNPPIPEIFAYREAPTSLKLNRAFAQFATAAQVSSITATVTGLQTTVAGLSSAVGSINQGDGGLLAGRVTTLETDVATAKTDITGLKSAVSGFTGVGVIPQQVAALQADLTAETAARQAAIQAEATARGNVDQGFANALAAKQDKLGFTPVIAGEGHSIGFGWDGTHLDVAVDAVQLGKVWTDNEGYALQTDNGYSILPSGMVELWGIATTTTGNNDVFYFPGNGFKSHCIGIHPVSLTGQAWVASGTGIIYPRVFAITTKNAQAFGMHTVLFTPGGNTQFSPGEAFFYRAWGY